MTAIEEITSLQATVGTITAERDAALAEIAKRDEAVQASVRLVETALSDNAALKAELAAVVETHGKATAEAAAKVSALESDLAKAKGLLRDPALAVVQAAVPSTTVPAGAEGGVSKKNRAQLEAEYAAIQGTDRRDTARLQAEFRKQNAQALGL
jgi:hypothetical protein